MLVFLIILGLLYSCHAQDTDKFTSNIFFKGDVLFKLDKESYSAGDTIKTEILVANMDDYPLADNSLVIDIVRGPAENHSYPSQLSDEDNVVFEAVVSGINLPAKSEKTVPFTYTIPSDARAGSYRLEVYLKNERAPIVGMAHIFMSPKHVSYTVTGKGAFPAASIVRTKTVFETKPGPIGVGVNASGKVAGEVYVQNEGAAELKDLILKVVVCSWDDTTCKTEGYFWSKDYAIASVASKATEKVVVEFNAPEKRDAYSIRLELLEKNGRMLSLYRSRFIVLGETAKIRKLVTDKLYYAADEKGTIKVLAAAAPDHYTNPVTKNAKLTVSISSEGSEVFSESYVIPELSGKTRNNGFVGKDFSFTAPKELREFTVCAKIESEKGELYDKYCFDASPEKAFVGETIIKAQTGYSAGVLEARICAEDASGIPAKAKASALIYTKDAKKVLALKEGLTVDPCVSASFKIPAGEYLLIVNTLDPYQQFRFNVKTSESSAVTTTTKAAAVVPTTQSEVVEATTTTLPPTGQDNNQLIIVGAAALIIIGIIAFFISKRGGKK